MLFILTGAAGLVTRGYWWRDAMQLIGQANSREVKLSDVVSAKELAEAQWRVVKDTDGGQGISKLLEAAKILRANAIEAQNSGHYAEAVKKYKEMAAQCSRIKTQDRQRQLAGKIMQDVAVAKAAAEEASVAKLAKTHWRRAEEMASRSAGIWHRQIYRSD